MSDLVAGTEPDVTVVVPVYNALPHLITCLDSLLAQTLIADPDGSGRMRVVAIDDGSTDGSGEELDRYAAAHRDLFTVHHQPNSGGPAKPCNVGLDLATGRYVFFLGADDHLGPEALERMVRRADEWGSDVLCGRIVGVNGRWVNQALFAEDAEDVPFPSELLASGLSNTKLFRRELLERHQIRYAYDMLVGSDQPFTVDAMRHARKISVLADYDYYFAVRRDDASNITYTSSWRSRLAAMTAIVDHVAPLLEEGPDRDAILQRHFSGEIATLLRRDFPEVSAEDQAELSAGVATLVERHLSPGISDRLSVPARVRFELARAGRVDDLRATAGLEDRQPRVLLDGDEAWQMLDGIDVPKPVTRMLRESPWSWLDGILDPARLEVEGSTLVVSAPSRFDPTSRPEWRVVLVRAPEARSRELRRRPRSAAPRQSFAVSLEDGGAISARVDLTRLARADRAGTWALRVQFDLGDNTWAMPVVPAEPLDPTEAVIDAPNDPDLQFTVSLAADPDGRALVVSNGRPRPASGRRPLLRKNG